MQGNARQCKAMQGQVRQYHTPTQLTNAAKRSETDPPKAVSTEQTNTVKRSETEPSKQLL
jgi:hypothetical protein